MSVVDTAKARLERAREASPLLDHTVRAVQHYGVVKGTIQAGAVTYFAFLSVFPILALAFAVIGYVVLLYPAAERDLAAAIQSVLPLVSAKDPAPGGKISLSAFEDAAGAAAGIGALGVLYSGLGWLSALREALIATFEQPRRGQPNFVVGKLKDLVSLVTIGVTLLASVAVAGVVTGLSDLILGWLGLDESLAWLLGLLGVAVGLVANTVLFYALFRLLADPGLPARAMWSGALLGAVGFEALKQLSALLIGSTQSQPAFAVFGISLVLLVWINYFSRVVILAASWAHTAPLARAAREAEAGDDRTPEGPRIDVASLAAPPPGVAAAPGAAAPAGSGAATGRAVPFAAGAASMLGLVALLRRRRR